MVLQKEKNITNQFSKYVMQDIFGMLGVSCYIIVDTFFISKAAGTNGITVLNLSLPIYSLIFAIGSMIGVGSATRFGILRAQKDETAETYFSNAICFDLLIGIPFVLAGIFLPDKILALMGGDQEIVGIGTPYFRIFLLFAPFFMSNYTVSSFVRNDKGTAVAMIGTIAGSLFNVLFDYLFMFVWGLGLAGAALATAASPIVSILICSIHFFQKKNTIRFAGIRVSIKKLLSSCLLGISAFVGEFSSAVTTTVFNFLILGYAGNVGIAAYGVIANYAMVVMAIFNGIAQGAQPLISSAYGTGNYPAQRTLLKKGIMLAEIFAVGILILTYLFTDPLIAVFNSEQSALLAEYAHSGMRIYFLGFLFAGANVVFTGYFSATERIKPAMLSSLLRGLAAIIGCAFLLSLIFGLTGVWMAFGAAECITIIVTVILDKKTRQGNAMM